MGLIIPTKIIIRVITETIRTTSIKINKTIKIMEETIIIDTRTILTTEITNIPKTTTIIRTRDKIITKIKITIQTKVIDLTTKEIKLLDKIPQIKTIMQTLIKEGIITIIRVVILIRIIITKGLMDIIHNREMVIKIMGRCLRIIDIQIRKEVTKIIKIGIKIQDMGIREIKDIKILEEQIIARIDILKKDIVINMIIEGSLIIDIVGIKIILNMMIETQDQMVKIIIEIREIQEIIRIKGIPEIRGIKEIIWTQEIQEIRGIIETQETLGTL